MKKSIEQSIYESAKLLKDYKISIDENRSDIQSANRKIADITKSFLTTKAFQEYQ